MMTRDNLLSSNIGLYCRIFFYIKSLADSVLQTILKVTVNVFDTKFGFRSLKAELLTESR